MIYLAAPFFTQEQLHLVIDFEVLLTKLGLAYYSPRSDGVLQDMTPEQRKASFKNVFEMNVRRMNEADTMLALMDFKDTGTTWELGYFTGRKRATRTSLRIWTYTTNADQMNVMLKECSDVHITGRDQALLFLSDPTAKIDFADARDGY